MAVAQSLALDGCGAIAVSGTESGSGSLWPRRRRRLLLLLPVLVAMEGKLVSEDSRRLDINVSSLV